MSGKIFSDMLFYGSLRDPDILAWVAGSAILDRHHKQVKMPHWQAFYVQDELYPILLPMKNEAVTVDLFTCVPQDCWERIYAYEGDDYEIRSWQWEGSDFRFFAPKASLQSTSMIWKLEVFQEHHKTNYLEAMKKWGVPRHS
ncbi:MAG: gamma-glutamylcyclotransferase [Pseudobacteriovorax sp.]|nr:gamma-glutamylcyclotransferase [Pseudobacteriovorax sp.]